MSANTPTAAAVAEPGTAAAAGPAASGNPGISIYGKQDVVSEWWQSKFERDAAKLWNAFYKRNNDRFFKDRHYLQREFAELDPGARERARSPRPTLRVVGPVPPPYKQPGARAQTSAAAALTTTAAARRRASSRRWAAARATRCCR